MQRRWSSELFPIARFVLLALATGGSPGCMPPPATEEAAAVTPRKLSAEEERRAVLEEVQRSGPPPADVAPKLQKAADTLFAQTFAPESIKGLMMPVGPAAACFRSGCVRDVLYTDQCAQLGVDTLLTRNAGAALLRWPGIVHRTPPIGTSDGRVGATWVFFIAESGYQRLDGALAGDGGQKPPPPPPPCPSSGGGTPTGIAPVAPTNLKVLKSEVKK